MAGINTIKVKELAKRSEQGPVDVIDVRTPVEYREVHLAMARNVPLDSLDPQALIAVPQRHGRAAALCDLPKREPLRHSLPEIFGGGLHECRQRGRRHAGLGRSRLAGGPRQKSDLP